ncbi:DUF5685 family protein [Nocardia farcinica]|uniref:DUF5685 family protein n=2 Tax=Nocardia farcinica TaxID=37329 RepID=UPI00226BD87E|nr:DUF5685 family protein [Nocardia farcinica]
MWRDRLRTGRYAARRERGAELFGMLRPCAHAAPRYGIDASQWRAHMCGLCLGLRDGHGQVARAATNTDAILLSVLTEAQAPPLAARTEAGRCPLRGMARAEVAAADAPGVQLAATASLLLGAAALRDRVDDGDAAPLTGRPMVRLSASWAARARTQARRIGFDVDPLVAAIATQTDRERSATDLAELTAATQLCAAEFFAHTAVLAGRADNADHLRTAGTHFGRIAHLADAVQDLDADRTTGRFNPLDASDTSVAQAQALIQESDAQIRRALAAAELAEVPTVRWMLLDPLHAVLHRVAAGTRHRPTRPGIGAAIGITLTQYCTGYACCADHTNPCTGRREQAWRKSCDCGSCCDCANCCSGCDGKGGCCDGCGCCDC